MTEPCSTDPTATFLNDSTLVGDVEQQEEPASIITQHQSTVNFNLTSTNCDATTKSFSSPGVSKLSRSRPLIPLRRSRPLERHWSPDLSCFRQPRSPDLPDEDFLQSSCSGKIAGEEEVASPLSRSRLLRRLLFNGRINESGKLHSFSTTDGLTVHNSDDTAGNSSRTDGNNDTDDLLVDVRRYRSLSRRDREHDSCDLEELEHCPSTPPLAVFLSSEDITSTIFPLRHATSEPASSLSRAPFNSSPLSARNSLAIGCKSVRTRWSKRSKECRPLSECIGTTLAMKLTGTLGTLTLTRARPAGKLLTYFYHCQWKMERLYPPPSNTIWRICDIYDFFAPHINVLTYLLTYLPPLRIACEFSG